MLVHSSQSRSFPSPVVQQGTAPTPEAEVKTTAWISYAVSAEPIVNPTDFKTGPWLSYTISTQSTDNAKTRPWVSYAVPETEPAKGKDSKTTTAEPAKQPAISFIDDLLNLDKHYQLIQKGLKNILQLLTTTSNIKEKFGVEPIELIQHLTGFLTQIEVTLLSRIPLVQRDYRNSLVTSKNDIVGEYLGVIADDIFPLRISFFLAMYLCVHKNNYLTVTFKEKIKLIIEEEILHTRFSLHILNIFNYARNAIRKDMHRSICEKLADEIIKQMLKQERPISFPSGWRSHTVYIELIKESMGVYLRINNGGRGSDDFFPSNHPHYPGRLYHLSKGKNEVYPCLLSKTPFSKIPLLQLYISNILFLKITDEKPEIAIPILYNASGELPKSDVDRFGYPAMPFQTIGNCGIYSYNIGMEIRLFSADIPKELFNILFQSELSFASRPLPANKKNWHLFLRQYPEIFLNRNDLSNPTFEILELIVNTHSPFTTTTPLTHTELEFIEQCLKSGNLSTDREFYKKYFLLLRDLSRITLNNFLLNDNDVQVLIKLLPCFPKLKYLDLSSNAITEVGARLLDAAKLQFGLTKVILNNNPMKSQSFPKYTAKVVAFNADQKIEKQQSLHMLSIWEKPTKKRKAVNVETSLPQEVFIPRKKLKAS